MDSKKAALIRARFVRRFSDLRLFDVKMARANVWRREVPIYETREAMTVGLLNPTLSARRYWRANAVDHADPVRV